MSKEPNICPYPGLRPFTEEESIYFKGRDRHINRIIEELSGKKFLMVTGASGDGKSSMIYAGLLPNVRAGFFKTKYNKWAIAVFRPGNNPLKNLAVTLAPQLHRENAQNVETSLSYGYSALIDLYKNTPLYLDEQSEEWIKASEEERKKIKHNTSNLLIVVDQFEEFFTNRENFDKETAIPSVTSQLVMNLLIETVRIATRDNLPVYIICTMRSDYIGNAPTFRGLPELIGDNHFFVPRLNREEILQVIQEPATLSGNKISLRLAQRLVNDLDVVNTDVLPVLQHALRQIWRSADNGNEEMDLIHFAKVGGMKKDDLPKEDQKSFEEWFVDLPQYKKKQFESPAMKNVLNMHANELYETLHNEMQQFKDEKTDTEQFKEQVQFIIKKAFQCLTKIDDSKAVRNRTTLEEMTEIIGVEGWDTKRIDKLLNIFRQQGNTLIYPFINEDPASENLKPDTLLDITHEALIRNWQRLGEWTKEEHESVIDYRELSSQLQRWIDNDRSKGHLLASGPFHYFRKWFRNHKPTPSWIKRYLVNPIYKTDGIAIKPLVDIADKGKNGNH